MLVPLYFELPDGRIANFGRVTMVGNTSHEGEIPLKGLKDIPRPAMLNYDDNVLSRPTSSSLSRNQPFLNHPQSMHYERAAS